LTRWEYKAERLTISDHWSVENKAEEMVDRLNAMGEHGWELVGFKAVPVGLAILKRPLAPTY